MPRTYVRRNGERVKSDNRTRFYVPRWVDPYFFIQGSSIEKMVMVELIRRGIYFEHTPQTNPLPWLDWMFEPGKNPEKWEADFLFPQYKIWLEIQGSYFHTLPGQVEQDALRAVYIESVGWTFLAWWEEDIRTRLHDLMNAVPQFYRIDKDLNESLIASRTTRGDRQLGIPFHEGGTGVDHLAGLRAALRGRARPPQSIKKRYATKRRPK
jgi:hypothetical protein